MCIGQNQAQLLNETLNVNTSLTVHRLMKAEDNEIMQQKFVQYFIYQTNLCCTAPAGQAVLKNGSDKASAAVMLGVFGNQKARVLHFHQMALSVRCMWSMIVQSMLVAVHIIVLLRAQHGAHSTPCSCAAQLCCRRQTHWQ